MFYMQCYSFQILTTNYLYVVDLLKVSFVFYPAIVAAARARAMAAANNDGNVPIAEIVCNSPGMNPPRSLPSTNAEQQQQ